MLSDLPGKLINKVHVRRLDKVISVPHASLISLACIRGSSCSSLRSACVRIAIFAAAWFSKSCSLLVRASAQFMDLGLYMI